MGSCLYHIFITQVKHHLYNTFFYFLGVQGIIQAYQNCIPQVELWGPTNTAPIIYHVARFAAAAQQEEGTKGAHVRIKIVFDSRGVN